MKEEIIEYVMFVCVLCALGAGILKMSVAFAMADGVETMPLNVASGEPTFHSDAMDTPDPCGLDVVVCEGEVVGTIREVTAYTSEVGQTDDSPCIAADGSDICARYAAGENICASNAFPLGSKITVDHLGTCTVADRMNRRYSNRVDWYFWKDTARALKMGRQNLLVTIK